MNEIVSSTALESSVRHRAPAIPFSSDHSINFEVEYLRAVAILLVVALHAHAVVRFTTHATAEWLQFVGSWTGVDLFFAISGYVISRSFAPSFDRHRRDDHWGRAACAFWVRRMFRLVPSAWLWLFIAVACSWAFAPSDWFGSLSGNIKSAGLIMINAANFAAADNALTGNGVYWTLALEDQFYLAFPFFLLLVPERWRWRVLLALIVMLVIPARPLQGWLWYTRLDAIMWGCLIYQLSRFASYWRYEPKALWRRDVALLVNATLIALLIIVPIARTYHRPMFTGLRVESIVAVVSAALVFLASFERGYVLPLPKLAHDVMSWIGSRSYAIYLIHIPLYGVIKETLTRLPISDAAYNAACVALIVVLLPALAELNFRFVEAPLRRKGRQLAKQIMGSSLKQAAPQFESAV